MLRLLIFSFCLLCGLGCKENKPKVASSSPFQTDSNEIKYALDTFVRASTNSTFISKMETIGKTAYPRYSIYPKSAKGSRARNAMGVDKELRESHLSTFQMISKGFPESKLDRVKFGVGLILNLSDLRFHDCYVLLRELHFESEKEAESAYRVLTSITSTQAYKYHLSVNSDRQWVFIRKGKTVIFLNCLLQGKDEPVIKKLIELIDETYR